MLLNSCWLFLLQLSTYYSFTTPCAEQSEVLDLLLEPETMTLSQKTSLTGKEMELSCEITNTTIDIYFIKISRFVKHAAYVETIAVANTGDVVAMVQGIAVSGSLETKSVTVTFNAANCRDMGTYSCIMQYKDLESDDRLFGCVSQTFTVNVQRGRCKEPSDEESDKDYHEIVDDPDYDGGEDGSGDDDGADDDDGRQGDDPGDGRHGGGTAHEHAHEEGEKRQRGEEDDPAPNYTWPLLLVSLAASSLIILTGALFLVIDRQYKLESAATIGRRRSGVSTVEALSSSRISTATGEPMEAPTEVLAPEPTTEMEESTTASTTALGPYQGADGALSIGTTSAMSVGPEEMSNITLLYREE